MIDPTITFDLPPLPDTTPVAPPQPTQRAQQGNLGMQGMPMQPVLGDNGDIIGPNPRPGDEKLFTVFYVKTVLDGIQTKAQGRPIYHDVDFVRIHIPGDKNTVIDRKVTDEDRSRFYHKYVHFKATQTNRAPDGMPLDEWTGLTRAQAAELKHFNVYTVEQLATLPDQFGQRFMGFFELRRKAQAYLSQAKDDAFAAKVAVENDELRAQLKQQQDAINVMSARMAAMEAQPKDTNVHDAAPSRAGRK